MSNAVRVPENFQYLRPTQEAELQRESDVLGQVISNPAAGTVDKGDMRKRKREIDRMLKEQSAPDLTPEQRDAFSKEARRLEAEFTVGMPSAEEMRKNPPGAVDRNLAWHHRNQRVVLRWKNLMRALHKGDTSPDIANVERFRKHTQASDLSMVGAQIPGKLFVGTNPSPEYRENYDRIFPKADQDEAPSPAPRTTRPKKPKVTMPCGKGVDGRGVYMHRKQCKKPECMEARAPHGPIPPETQTEQTAGAPSAAE